MQLGSLTTLGSLKRTSLNNGAFADAAAWESAKNLFRYLARLEGQADPEKYCLTPGALALRVWEKVCDYRGVPADKRPPLDMNAEIGTQELFKFANEFSRGFGGITRGSCEWEGGSVCVRYQYEDQGGAFVLPDPFQANKWKVVAYDAWNNAKVSLGTYVRNVLQQMRGIENNPNISNDSASWRQFCLYMQRFEGPHQDLFQSLNI